MFLNIPFNTLEEIELDQDGVDNRKMEMFDHWLKSGTANKEALLVALRKMGERLQGMVSRLHSLHIYFTGNGIVYLLFFPSLSFPCNVCAGGS